MSRSRWFQSLSGGWIKLLDLFSCENVTEGNVLDWNKQGFKKNWNLTVQFNLCEDTCIYDVQ